jgi:hypothetical protein
MVLFEALDEEEVELALALAAAEEVDELEDCARTTGRVLNASKNAASRSRIVR